MRTLAELRKKGMDSIVDEIQKITLPDEQETKALIVRYQETKKEEDRLLQLIGTTNVQDQRETLRAQLDEKQKEKQANYERISGCFASKEKEALYQSLARIMETYNPFLEQYEEYERWLLREKSRNKNFDIVSALQKWQESCLHSLDNFFRQEEEKRSAVREIKKEIKTVVKNHFTEQLEFYRNRQIPQPTVSEKHERWLKPKEDGWKVLSSKDDNKPGENIKPYVDSYSKPKEALASKGEVSTVLADVAAYVKSHPQTSVYINHFPEKLQSYAYQDAAVLGINSKNIVGYRPSSSEAQKAKKSYENTKKIIPRSERRIKSEAAGRETSRSSVSSVGFDFFLSTRPDIFSSLLQKENEKKKMYAVFNAMNFMQRAKLLDSEALSFDQKIQCLLALPFPERLFVLNESQTFSPPLIDPLLALKMAGVLHEKLQDPNRKANFSEQLSVDLKPRFRLNEQVDKWDKLEESKPDAFLKETMFSLTSAHLGLDNISRDVTDFIEKKKKITSFPSTLSSENKATVLKLIEENSGELGRFASSLQKRISAVNELLGIDKDLGSSVAAGLICTLRNRPEKIFSILTGIDLSVQKDVIQKLGSAAVIPIFLDEYSQGARADVTRNKEKLFKLLSADQKFYVLLALRGKFKNRFVPGLENLPGSYENEYDNYLRKALSGEQGYVEVFNVLGAAKVLMGEIKEHDSRIEAWMGNNALTINAKIEMIEVLYKKGCFDQEDAWLLNREVLEKLEKRTQGEDLRKLLLEVIQEKEEAGERKGVVSALESNPAALDDFLQPDTLQQQQAQQSASPPLTAAQSLTPPSPPSNGEQQQEQQEERAQDREEEDQEEQQVQGREEENQGEHQEEHHEEQDQRAQIQGEQQEEQQDQPSQPPLQPQQEEQQDQQREQDREEEENQQRVVRALGPHSADLAEFLAPQSPVASASAQSQEQQEQQTQVQPQARASTSADQAQQRLPQAATETTGMGTDQPQQQFRPDSLREQAVRAASAREEEESSRDDIPFGNTNPKKQERVSFFKITKKLFEVFPSVVKNQFQGVKSVIKKQDPQSAYLLEGQQKSTGKSDTKTKQSSAYQQLTDPEGAKSAEQKTPPKTPPNHSLSPAEGLSPESSPPPSMPSSPLQSSGGERSSGESSSDDHSPRGLNR